MDTKISLNPCVGHCNVFLRVISLEIVTVFFMNNPNEEIIINPIPQDCISDIKSVGLASSANLTKNDQILEYPNIPYAILTPILLKVQ